MTLSCDPKEHLVQLVGTWQMTAVAVVYCCFGELVLAKWAFLGGWTTHPNWKLSSASSFHMQIQNKLESGAWLIHANHRSSVYLTSKVYLMSKVYLTPTCLWAITCPLICPKTYSIGVSLSQQAPWEELRPDKAWWLTFKGTLAFEVSTKPELAQHHKPIMTPVRFLRCWAFSRYS